MDRKKFFSEKSSKVTHEEVLSSLKSNSIDILQENYLWVSKIYDKEAERYNSLRKKSENLLTVHMSILSLLLGGVIVGFIRSLATNWLITLLLIASITCILLANISGILYALKVIGVPHFGYVLDPTLVFETHKSKVEWLRKAIAETLVTYKKGTELIGEIGFKTRISFDLLILAISAILFTAPLAASIFLFMNAKENFNLNAMITGGIILGVCFFVLIFYFIRYRPRDYRKVKKKIEKIEKERNENNKQPHEMARFLIVFMGGFFLVVTALLIVSLFFVSNIDNWATGLAAVWIALSFYFFPNIDDWVLRVRTSPLKNLLKNAVFYNLLFFLIFIIILILVIIVNTYVI